MVASDRSFAVRAKERVRLSPGRRGSRPITTSLSVMTDPRIVGPTSISPVAEKCGRIAFWLYGAVLVFIGGSAAYVSPTEHAVLASAVIFWGITMIILGYVLPPKPVAHLGILLPW